MPARSGFRSPPASNAQEEAASQASPAEKLKLREPIFRAGEARLKATYGDNYARLVQIKNQYDPKNLFRLNANIRPSVHV